MELKNKDISLLTSILNDFATFSDQKSLLYNIILKLNGLYGVEHVGFGIFDDTKEHITMVMTKIEKDNYALTTNVWFKNKPINKLPFNIKNMEIKIIEIEANYFYDFEKLTHESVTLAETLKKNNCKSIKFIPMHSRGELIGYFLITSEEYEIGHENLDYTLLIANLLGSALNSAKALENIRRKEKEKEKQIELLSKLISIKEKEKLFLLLSESIYESIPFEHLTIYTDLKNINVGQGFTLQKDKNDKLTLLSYSESITQSIMALKSLLNTKILNNYYEVQENDLAEICKKIPYFRRVKEKNLIKSFLILSYLYEGHGEIYLILGRKNPGYSNDENEKIEYIFSSQYGSFFSNQELELSMVLLPQIGLLLENLYSFDKINSLTKKLEQEYNYLLEEINSANSFEEIIGTSRSINETLDKVKQVAPIDANVLILGETGTGKELIAKAVHNLSRRKDQAFITINCAALPAQLIESELFGHELGSFTGAVERRIGKFEIANKGTIFLDEIGELPIEIQAKLLRVLQEKEFERIGGKSTIYSDVRIVAATNRNLEKEVENGKFRADLFFRLNVFPIRVAPLRERKEDIPLLVKHFIDKFSKRIGKEIKSVKKNDIEYLMQYNWPGNIRELEHVIERAIIISKDSSLNFELMMNEGSATNKNDLELFKTLEDMEKEYIINAIKLSNGKITGEKSAAQLLGINGKTLGSKMLKLGIKRKFIVVEE
ncbi:MAG: sigma 54-interacting transcriptional regulator [Melioribacteraceae bacterium]